MHIGQHWIRTLCSLIDFRELYTRAVLYWCCLVEEFFSMFITHSLCWIYTCAEDRTVHWFTNQCMQLCMFMWLALCKVHMVWNLFATRPYRGDHWIICTVMGCWVGQLNKAWMHARYDAGCAVPHSQSEFRGSAPLMIRKEFQRNIRFLVTNFYFQLQFVFQ